MNLLKLTESSVPPHVIADALIRKFDSVEQREALNAWPFTFCLIAGDEDRPRLVILFAHFRGRWQYQIHAPHILRQIRTQQ